MTAGGVDGGRRGWTDDDVTALRRDAGVAVSDALADRDGASRDFGGIATGAVSAIARPTDADGVARIVAFAASRGLSLAPRGLGKSQSGQSIPRDGVSLDLRGLDAVGPVDEARRRIRCGAGATYRAVVEAAARAGLVPEVVPLNLDLTVGGVLSAGGFGSTSHVAGAAVAHVPSLGVVTGRGARLACSEATDRQAFDAALGGVGRAVVITDAELALRGRRPRLRTFCLMYDDVATMLADQRALVARPPASRPAHLEGFCSASVQGLRKGPAGRRVPFAYWSYGLHASFEHDGDGDAPLRDAALAGLGPTRVVHVEDDETDAFASRYDVRFEAMRATGADAQLHPWLECMLPADAAAELVPRALAMLPLLLGDGHRVTWIADRTPRGSLAFPGGGEGAVTFAVLPMGVPAPFREPAMKSLEAVHRMLVDAGGKRYLSGYLFGMDEAAWRRHYGADFDRVRDATRALDPSGVFRSALPFPGA